MPDFADQLLAEFDAATCWPLEREKHAHERVRQGIALRKGQLEHLRNMHARMGAPWPTERMYVVDPLAKRIAVGYADFLFADEPVISCEEDTAQDELNEVIEHNRFASSLHRAERRVVSEGELYWKMHVNASVAAVPLITWSSRLSVVPLFYGDRLLAAAFVTERASEMARNTEGVYDSSLPRIVYRHAEVHTLGRVLNAIYQGDEEHLGRRVSLESRPETAGYAEEIVHGLPMWAGRVVNDLDDDDTLGESEYSDSVTGMLLALNEAMTIAAENARLTGKDRIFAAGKFLGMDGSLDASVEVFHLDQNPATTLGESPTNPSIYGVEKTYDAVPLWLHITNLVKTIVSRVGLVPQWIGEQVDGTAESGTAIRLRFLPTTNAAKGKMREWQDQLPHMMGLALQIIALPVASGGFGRGAPPAESPSVEFTDPLPADSSEVTIDVTTAVAGEVMSRRTAVEQLHPSWNEEQVDEELDEIAEDVKGAAPEPTLFGPPEPQNGAVPPVPAPSGPSSA